VKIGEKFIVLFFLRFSGKNLWTDIKNGDKIDLYQATDASDEAKHIVDKIREFTRQHSDISLSQIAILYRTNAQCNEFEHTKKNIELFYL